MLMKNFPIATKTRCCTQCTRYCLIEGLKWQECAEQIMLGEWPVWANLGLQNFVQIGFTHFWATCRICKCRTNMSRALRSQVNFFWLPAIACFLTAQDHSGSYTFAQSPLSVHDWLSSSVSHRFRDSTYDVAKSKPTLQTPPYSLPSS